MKLQITLLVLVLVLATTIVSAAALPFNPNDFMPGARFMRPVFGAEVPVDWNPEVIDDEIALVDGRAVDNYFEVIDQEGVMVARVTNVHFSNVIESSSNTEHLVVDFDIQSLSDVELSQMILTIYFNSVGADSDHRDQRVFHFNPNDVINAVPLMPHELRHKRVVFDIEPCDVGAKQLSFYLYQNVEVLPNGDQNMIGIIQDLKYNINVVQSNECRPAELSLIQNNIQYKVENDKLVVNFDVTNPNDFDLTEVYMDVTAGNVADWDAVVDPNHDVYSLFFNYAHVLGAHQTYNAHVEIPLPGCFGGDLNLDIKSYSFNEQLGTKENLDEDDFVYDIISSCIPEVRDYGTNEDLPIDNVDLLNELEAKYKTYDDRFDSELEQYKDALTPNDKDKVERELEKLDNKLKDLEDEIVKLKDKHDDNIKERLNKLDEKVKELRNKIKNLLNGKEVIGEKEPEALEFSQKDDYIQVRDSDFSATGLTVGAFDLNGIGYYVLLIAGILITLGLIIWVLSLVLRY